MGIMPQDAQTDVMPSNYERILPKMEAPSAAMVGSMAWIFVACFIAMLVSLDIPNLYQSGKLFFRNMNLLIPQLLRVVDLNKS